MRTLSFPYWCGAIGGIRVLLLGTVLSVVSHCESVLSARTLFCTVSWSSAQFLGIGHKYEGSFLYFEINTVPHL